MKIDSAASMVDLTLPLIDGTAAVTRATGVRVKLIGILSRTYGAEVAGATRIGHALRAGEDPAFLDHLAEHRIGIEANLTSNVQTSSIPGYEANPGRATSSGASSRRSTPTIPRSAASICDTNTRPRRPGQGLIAGRFVRRKPTRWRLPFSRKRRKKRYDANGRRWSLMAKSRRETLSRIRRRVSEMPPLSTGVRVILGVFGWVLILLGVVQLLIPGPGLLTMVTGAAVLSLVSRRAHNLLRWLFRPWPWAWQKLLQLRRRIRERIQ